MDDGKAVMMALPRRGQYSAEFPPQVTRAGRWSGFLVAALVATSVFVVLFLQSVLIALVAILVAVSSDGFSLNGMDRVAVSYLGVAAPFAVGVFVSLWLIAPIDGARRLPHVCARSILAAVVGSLCLLGVTVLLGTYNAISFSGHWSINLLAGFRFSVAEVSFAITNGSTLALQSFVGSLPLVMLAAIMLWIWSGRHPHSPESIGPAEEPAALDE